MTNEREELGFPPPHPGEYIREDILPALNMTVTDLARHLGVTRATLSELINGHRGVSTNMAIRLGKAFRNGARFWLALQLQYDLWKEERKGALNIGPLNWNDDAA